MILFYYNILTIKGEQKMSLYVRIPHTFFMREDLTVGEKLVVMALTSKCQQVNNGNHSCIISKRELSVITSMAKTTLYRYLKMLEGKEIIKIEKRTGFFGGDGANEYFVPKIRFDGSFEKLELEEKQNDRTSKISKAV